MEFKKWLLLLVFVLGLSSCSSDGGSKDAEIVYADTKPTQAKYKAYYGTILIKTTTSTTSKVPDTSVPGQNGATAKPVSAIFYPETQTISFSNVFDNKTVEYKVSEIKSNPGVSVIYESNNTCTVSEKSGAIPANVTVTFPGGYYKFDITASEEK